MSNILIPFDCFKQRIPLQSISKLMMNINESNDDNIIINSISNVINVVEKHVLNLKEENYDDVQSLVNDLKDFVSGLKINSKFCKSNSLLSIVDIKIDVEDETTIIKHNYKEGGAPESNLILKSNINFKDSCTLTEDKSTSDVHIQTMKLKNDYNQDFDQNLYHLRGKTVEFEEIGNIYIVKKKILYKTIEMAIVKLQDLVRMYDPISDKSFKTFCDEGSETCSSWLQRFETSIERLKQLPALKERLEEVTKKNKQLDERHCVLSHEAEKQFEMMEDLANNNEQMVPIIDSLSVELTETREINEFLESENQGLAASIDTVYEDFRNNLIFQTRAAREAKLSFTTDRASWSSERRAFDHKFADKELNFNLDRRQKTFYEQRVLDMNVSVRNFPLCGSSEENRVIEHRKKQTLLADQVLELRQDVDRWDEEKQFIYRTEADEQCPLKRSIVSLTEERDQLSQNLVTATERHENYQACFQELQEIYMAGDGDHIEADQFSRVLAKYGM